MSRLIYIVGETGSGKSYSLKNVSEKDTYIISCVGKELPFKQGNKRWNKANKNYWETRNPASIIDLMERLDKVPHIKNIIIDDFQYVMSFEYLENLDKDVWDTFRNIGGHVFQIVNKARHLRPDLNVFILTHSDTIMDAGVRKSKIKTVGKMTDEKITLEGLSSIVLYTETEIDPATGKVVGFFVTQNDGHTTAKSPEDMFPETRIPNDLKLVIEAINDYY